MFGSPDSSAGGTGFESGIGGKSFDFEESGIPGSQVLLRAIALFRGDHILHLACGAGYLTERLAARVGAEGWVLAIDPSAERLKAAAARVAYPWVSFREGRLIPPGIPSGAIDHVVLEECPFRFDEPGRLFQEISRVLRCDGRFWLHHPRHQVTVVNGRPEEVRLRFELAQAGLVMLGHHQEAESFFAQAIKVTN